MLEGSIAVTGALIQWLRDRLKIIDSAPEVEELARSVDDNGGVYFVPAFSGLFAPYWRDDARGVIVGLTAYANRGHIARAALEAAAWQTREVVDAANAVADVPFTELRVDGGMTANELLMQFQADVLGVPVIRPKVTETTALGAAYAAGLATGFWADQDELRERWAEDKRWEPEMDEDERERAVRALEEGGPALARLGLPGSEASLARRRGSARRGSARAQRPRAAARTGSPGRGRSRAPAGGRAGPRPRCPRRSCAARGCGRAATSVWISGSVSCERAEAAMNVRSILSASTGSCCR